MKISFQNANNTENLIQTGKASNNILENAGKTCQTKAAIYNRNNASNMLIGDNEKNKSKSLAEFKQEIENLDVNNMQNMRTVLSNTLSAKDYAKACEEGYDLSEMDPEDVVTIVDKIKAELVKAGKDIKGYTDDLDVETLANALGSSSLANELVNSFDSYDIPVTSENIADVKAAWELASNMSEISEQAYGYMVENQLEPAIWDFYLAKNSGVDNKNTSNGPGFISENINGYYSKAQWQANEKITSEDAEKILSLSEIEVNEENKELAKNLLNEGIEVSEENIERLKQLKSVSFPVSEEVFAKAVSNSILEGKNAVQANLTKTDNVFEKAKELFDFYTDDSKAIALNNLENRITLEEIRLKMTVEVNVKLIQSGFAIDTMPMEEMLQALKAAEKEIADKYFPGEENSVEKYELYNRTNETVSDIKILPADVVVNFNASESIEIFHKNGLELKGRYIAANASYETLMTAPRADLGDNINKAFTNVDDILEDMKLDLSEENRKTIRILGHNSMEINEENINRVRSALLECSSIISKMTPASTLKMIREGANPLTMSFDELNEYFDNRQENFEEESKSYSRFLYELEKSNNITAEERESYIGIYRLLNQVERRDFASVGAVVNSQAELNFSTLLSAARSNRSKNIDIKIDNSFGAIEELIKDGKSIDNQVFSAYEHNEEYEREQLNLLREAARVEDEIVSFLDNEDIELTANNLLAAQSLFGSGRALKKNLFNQVEEFTDRKDEAELFGEADAEKLIESMDSKNEFTKEYSEFIEKLDAGIQSLTLYAADSSLDVAALSLSHKQIGIISKLSNEETFSIPMYIDSELTRVQVSFLKDENRKGEIKLSADVSEGHIEIELFVKDKTVSGYLSGNTPEAVNKLKNVSDIFSTSVNELDGYRVESISAIRISEGAQEKLNLPTKNMEVHWEVEETNNNELYRIAKKLLLAMEK